MKSPRALLHACLLATLIAGAEPAAAADPYPWELETGREAAVIGTGALCLGVGWLADRDSRPLTPAEIAALDPAGLGPLDRGATRRWSPGASRASDVLVATLIAAPVGLMVSEPGAARGGQLALIYAETMLLAGGVTYALKNLVARPRPYAYNTDPRIPAELRLAPAACRSFPSGHTTQAFASMVFFAGTFARLNPASDARGWVWGGCLTAAATTGVLRWLAGRHFPTDILAGAAVGATAGWLVPRLHESDDASQGTTGGGARIALGFAF